MAIFPRKDQTLEPDVWNILTNDDNNNTNKTQTMKYKH